jgi:ribonuclease BN (tRNA processing enzyme)
MKKDNFEVTFLGTNGSCAYNNGNRKKYGSNTLCVAVKTGEEVIILDAGTGLCGLTELSRYDSKKKHLFLTHYHMDHIEGLLFYPDLFEPDKEIVIYGIGDAESTLNELISPPLCPVGPEVFNASIEFKALETNQEIALPGDVIVKTFPLSHPGGALGCRIEYCEKVLCYCVDIELQKHKNDTALMEFFADADLLILDASFADGKVIPGWGHSSPGECAQWAANANVELLALYHYNYRMTDDDIDKMAEKAKIIHSGTFAATDGMSVNL